MSASDDKVVETIINRDQFYSESEQPRKYEPLEMLIATKIF